MSKTSQRVLAAKQKGFDDAQVGIKTNPFKRSPLRAAYTYGQRAQALVAKSLETYEPTTSV